MTHFELLHGSVPIIIDLKVTEQLLVTKGVGYNLNIHKRIAFIHLRLKWSIAFVTVHQGLLSV